MDDRLNQLTRQPLMGVLCVLVVFFGLAIGHSIVVLQREMTGGVSLVDTVISAILGFTGLALVWIGMKKSETQATILGYIGGNLVWIGFFEWTWLYFSHWMKIEPIMDRGMIILSPELLLIQATGLLLFTILVFLGANKDTRCRMFMWFHRNFGLRPGTVTPGFKRQHAKNTAMETVFLIWTIYMFAIIINDPRLIRYDSVAAMIITAGFVVWAVYLFGKLLKIRTFGPAFRYAIPTGNIMWLPIEAFSRWGLYPEVWIKPNEYAGIMAGVLILFILGISSFYRTGRPQAVAA